MFTKLAVVAARSMVKNVQGSTRSEIARSAVRSVSKQVDAVRLPAPDVPTSRRDRALAAVVYWGFWLCLVLSVAGLLGFLALNARPTWLIATKVVLGCLLIAEGVLLMADWRGARRLLLLRLRHRYRSPDGKETLRQSLYWRAMKPGLGLVGLIWLCLGLLTALLGIFPNG
jgi:hypothetical protein